MKIQVTSKMDKTVLDKGLPQGLIKIGALSSLANSIVSKIDKFIDKNTTIDESENGSIAYLHLKIDGVDYTITSSKLRANNLNNSKIIKANLRDKLFEILNSRNIPYTIVDNDVVWNYEIDISFDREEVYDDRPKRKKG